jgi:hypothetical protein
MEDISTYIYLSGPNDKPLHVVPPVVEASRRPGKAATRSPVTDTVCLQGKCGANTVHFGQADYLIVLWLSYQELTIERNVNIGEELL